MKEILKEIIREELAGLSANSVHPQTAAQDLACVDETHDKIAVLVCTDKRGVVFGHTQNRHADPIVVTDARMALYWSAATGGVFGLAEKGPDKDCKISATAKRVELTGVTAVFDVEDTAIKAWEDAGVQGR